MKPIKMLGLTALLALLAMAFVGASSAMAEGTQLCTADETPCESANLVTHVHETTLSGAKATLLNSVSNVLCDVLFLGEAYQGTTEGSVLVQGNFTYTNCLDEKPNTCTVTEESGPVNITVLKEGHETAKVTGEGEVKVVCTGISCKYNGEGLVGTGKGPLLSSETNGEVSIVEQTTKKVSGLLCPATAKLDIKTTPLVKVSLSQAAGHYCVKYEKAHGFYLNVNGANHTECIEKDSTRVGNYALVWGPAGLTAGEMVCVLLNEPKGLYEVFVNTKECKTDSASNTGWWELGTIQ
jgi:hypothetical protein